MRLKLATHKIAGNLQIGGIYECNFGSYKSIHGGTTEKRDEADSNKLDYRIPNEMIKSRPVVVISKHRGVCTVIPVSTTPEKAHKNPKKDLIENGIVFLYRVLFQQHIFTIVLLHVGEFVTLHRQLILAD